ncbi:hypothetical protein PDESU_05001 [Pontiella desulfatans]|uniref:VWFA domain-containing protein n=1 Tax=Pontiella desulfatans TaxID=2750659 RepID=A0A6C2U8M4_PONDE|nr:hypothetical protein [Pontiella desulfatans]VGO16410.1 hypothetical protein PDESU_05001 [Pontiella desulfatans]
MKANRKGFFGSHAKSSAAVVSLAIHALLVVVALSFVAVTVITKEEKAFEAKPVNRPKMQLKKLQVPVNIKKKSVKKPKLRKRIVVQPKMNQNMPDIKMPEITGVKGGLGAGAVGGLGGGEGLGFSMPEIEIFGVKGKGEKIFLILDTGNHMLIDEMGGIPAYNIIKDEMVRIVEELPPTALFNVCIFQGGQVQTLFPALVAATDSNAAKTKAWLDPLNASANAAKSGNFGIQTLGSGGVNKSGNYRIGKFAEPLKKGGSIYGDEWSGGRVWYDAAMCAMQQQADTVFILSNSWGHQRVALENVPTMDEWKKTTSAGKKWVENVEKGRAKLAEENAQRKAAGQPPKVISGGEYGIIRTYFDGTQRPPEPDYYYYKPKDFAQAFVMMKDQYRPKDVQTASGLKKKSGKVDFSLNVVQFIRQDAGSDERSSANFSQLTQICKGQYQTVSGLEEIQSYVK